MSATSPARPEPQVVYDRTTLAAAAKVVRERSNKPGRFASEARVLRLAAGDIERLGATS